jgi:hypothetical protein
MALQQHSKVTIAITLATKEKKINWLCKVQTR